MGVAVQQDVQDLIEVQQGIIPNVLCHAYCTGICRIAHRAIRLQTKLLNIKRTTKRTPYPHQTITIMSTKIPLATSPDSTRKLVQD